MSSPEKSCPRVASRPELLFNRYEQSIKLGTEVGGVLQKYPPPWPNETSTAPVLPSKYRELSWWLWASVNPEYQIYPEATGVGKLSLAARTKKSTPGGGTATRISLAQGQLDSKKWGGVFRLLEPWPLDIQRLPFLTGQGMQKSLGQLVSSAKMVDLTLESS